MKKIPYGLDNYEVIITQDYYYIDKTKYIRTVEEQCNYDACTQLQQYISDHHLEDSALLRHTPLTALYLIFREHTLVAYGEYKAK